MREARADPVDSPEQPSDPAAPPFRGSAVHLRRNPWVLGGIALAGAAYVFVAHWKTVILGMAVYTSAMLLWTAWQRNWRPRRVPVAVEATRAGLRLDGGDLAPRASFVDGVLVPRDGAPPLVRLRRRRRPDLDLEVADAEAARALLAGLGFGAGQAVAQFRVGSPWLRFQGPILGAYLLVLFGMMAALFAGGADALSNMLAPGLSILALTTLALAPLVIPSTLVIGADGLRVRWLGRERVFPFSEVERFDRRQSRFFGTILLDVKLRSGQMETLSLDVRAVQANTVIERIREALTAARDASGTEATAAALARRDRPLAAWIAGLRSLGAGANATHRTAPLSPDTLWRVVEDVRAEAGLRAAAAVALTADLGEPGRARLLSTAEGVAAPRLRVALETAARTADEAALEEALAALEEGSRERGTAT